MSGGSVGCLTFASISSNSGILPQYELKEARMTPGAWAYVLIGHYLYTTGLSFYATKTAQALEQLTYTTNG